VVSAWTLLVLFVAALFVAVIFVMLAVTICRSWWRR
jgi:hypothetical protein